jgi:tripeptide aminopeptidase
MAMFPTTNAARQAPQSPKLVSNPRVLRALAKLGADAAATTDEQARITEIPAPSFHEAARAAYLGKLLSDAGLDVTTDEEGNVIGERPGRSRKDLVLVVAHLDTVFPEGTDVHVRRDAGRLYAPGISDNGAGLASLVALARAMRDAQIETLQTVLLVADVGEEGEGNLRGMRKLVEAYRGRLRYVIALDGAATDYVATAALASRRVEITISGPGGHSWSDFGAPNPIHAAARGVAQFVSAPLPASPRSSFNVGEIQGGTSVNSIPAEASIKVDLRSESEAELAKLEAALRKFIQAGVSDEMAFARARGMGSKPLQVDWKILGVRPGGELPADSPLRAAVQAADDYLGNRSRAERSSTDANIPLSLGIPAIALGAGGSSAGAHSLGEWYDPSGRVLGLQRALLTLLGVAGVAPE